MEADLEIKTTADAAGLGSASSPGLFQKLFNNSGEQNVFLSLIHAGRLFTPGALKLMSPGYNAQPRVGDASLHHFLSSGEETGSCLGTPGNAYPQQPHFPLAAEGLRASIR